MAYSSGRRWLTRLGVALGAIVGTVAVSELALRAVGFEFRLYPKRIEFGYPDPEVLEDFFHQHPDYLWVSASYRKRVADARRERPHLVLAGCSCTEWGGFAAPLARMASETPGLAPLSFANLANSGWSTYQGLQQMRREIVDLAPEVVTIYFGWNDHWMGFGVDDATAARLSRSGGALDRADLRIVQLVTKVRIGLGAGEGDAQGTGARPNRVALDDFRANLREMVAVAREADIVPVLVTAPSSHVAGEEPEYLSERWLEDLSRLVPLHRSYVEVVREVAADEDVVLCDLAAAFDALPRDEVLTYMKEDGIHFTPEGGEKVAELLFATLRAHDLLPEAAEAPRNRSE